MAHHRWNYLCILFMCLFLQIQTESFVLEGSPSSYACFRKWICHLNCSFSFQFQTLNPSGLLLYTENGNIFNFIEMKLVEGVLRFHFSIKDVRRIFSVGNNLHDGLWHQVKILHNINETLLKLNENTVGRVSHEIKYTFSNNIADNYLCIGGIPSNYKSNPIALRLPSVAFELTFKGGIKRVLYSSEEERVNEQNIIESKGVRSNHLNACRHQDPCQHGGICISTDRGFICDCRFIDYEGTYCEKVKPPSEITFQGNEYLYYHLTPTQSIVSLKDELSLYFKTRHSSGMIIYSGHGEDFLSLTMRDGGIIFTMNLGSKLEEKIVRPTRVRFNDNLWHRILIYRKVRKFTETTSFCHFSITVDGIHTERGSLVGSFSLFLSNVLYVGGRNPLSNQIRLRGKQNFVGCLQKVFYVADSLTLDVIRLARNKNKLIHHHKNLHFICHEVEAENPVTFTTTESFLVLPSWKAAKSGNISFKLRTNEPNGLLMYNRGAPEQRDFFAFELFEGYIYLLLDLGSGLIKVKTTTRRIDDKHWHTVVFVRTGKNGRVTVDDSALEFITTGHSKQLDLEGPLILGGIGIVDQQQAGIPVELWSAKLKYGYVGCIRDLVINGKVIDIASFAQKQDSSSIHPFCRISPRHCDSQPCLNGGKCSEGWNRFICDCSHTSFSGTICAKDATTLSFNNGQFMKITIPESSYTQAEDVILRFRTTRPNSLMIATSSNMTFDQLLVILELGRVKVALNIGDSMEVFLIGQGLNDDHWHTLKIIRRGQSMFVQLDLEYLHKKFNGQKTLLGFTSIYIGTVLLGNDSTSNLLNMAKEMPNFIGQMQHFIFNGISFFDVAKNGQMPNSLITATFGENGRAVYHAVTFKSKFTFIVLPQLKAYSSLNLYFQFKTLEPNGLLLYNGGKDQDYLAIELVDGHLHYIFNLGNGQQRLRSNTRNTLNNNQWHTVTIRSSSLKQHTLMVDNTFATVTDTGSNAHLDLDGLLYLGGIRNNMFAALSNLIYSNHGFKGCLASLDLNGDVLDLANDSLVHNTLVSVGCIGPVTKCSDTACANRGICVQMWNSYSCDCDMTSFTGPSCSDESTAYKFGPKGGLIMFQYSLENTPDTKNDFLALGLVITTTNAVLMRIDSSSSNDYMELQIIDGNVFIVYNLGNEDHSIREYNISINDGRYHIIRFTRLGPNSTIQVDDHKIRIKHSKAKKLTTFNSQSVIQIGGKKNFVKGEIDQPFEGILAGLVFNGQRILDMAAKQDSRVTIEGQVELLGSIPFGLRQINSLPTQQSTSEIEDYGPINLDCLDDDDHCSEKSTGGDLIESVNPTILYKENDAESKHCDGKYCTDNTTSQLSTFTPVDDFMESIYAPKQAENNEMSITKPRIPSLTVIQTTYLPSFNDVSVPYTPGKRNVRYQATRNSKSSANSTILIIGIIAGVLVGTIMIVLMTYRVGNQSEESYTIDVNKGCQFTSTAISANTPLMTKKQYRINGAVKSKEPATSNIKEVAEGPIMQACMCQQCKSGSRRHVIQSY